jgi:hypothetical protein
MASFMAFPPAGAAAPTPVMISLGFGDENQI